MLRFQHISYLYAFALVPLFLALFIATVYWRQRRIKKLGDTPLVNSQLKGFISGRNTLKFILISIAFTAIVLGWANLQSADKVEKVQRKGVDVVIALDVSKSMLANDVQPNRLTRAKQLILRLMDNMQNDRIALILFAGRSYVQVPLTVDYTTVKMMLQNAGPDMVPTQGTVISDAVDMAMQSFSSKEKKYKSLIIISDGEDHDEKAISKVNEASDMGIIVHTVGIGSPQGATLYDPLTKSAKLDENGQPVISKLNESELKSIAAAGHGTYSLLQNPDEVAQRLHKELEGMEQKNLGAVMFTDYTSYFQYFLLVGIIFLMVEWLLPGANMKKIKTA